MKPRDIEQRSFEFACQLVRFCDRLGSSGFIARTLAHQLLRAGTSIGANLEEAVAGQTKPDFISKCFIALKEARETTYWLRLIIATQTTDKRAADLLNEARQLVAIITVIAKNAQSTPRRG